MLIPGGSIIGDLSEDELIRNKDTPFLYSLGCHVEKDSPCKRCNPPKLIEHLDLIADDCYFAAIKRLQDKINELVDIINKLIEERQNGS